MEKVAGGEAVAGKSVAGEGAIGEGEAGELEKGRRRLELELRPARAPFSRP